MNAVPLDQLVHATFAPLKGTRFHAQLSPDDRVELELIDVRQLTTHTPPNEASNNSKRECFSLTFSGPITPHLSQNTYAFTHPQIGQFLLFMVPIGRTQQGFQYEVIFNRLT